MSEKRWTGKVAWITGATSGIGRAIAERLVSEGMKVCLSARSEGRLSELQVLLGPNAISVPTDVTQEASVHAAGRRIAETWGGLDVLVNNAGLGYQESLLDGSIARFREMLDVNILGLLLSTQEGIALMKGREEGHIFHLGSLSGHRVPQGSNVYGATKFAVRSLAESLRQELHQRQLPIRVTTLSPGFVETEFHQRYFGSAEKSEELYSRFQVLAPQDIADALYYALNTPTHVAIHDILVRSVYQGS